MVDDTNQDDPRLKKPALKVEEPPINVDTPWTDDRLDRKRIADRLTTVIEDQQAPFVLSLDGRWGTGKTFLLKRWQQALVNDKYQAIYFNAWEDDFCDDPLLAIIGQLTEHFQEGKLREMAAIIGEIALPILTAKLTGVAFTRKDLKRDNLLADYRTQLRTKREIGNHLTRLAAVVKEQTGKPLVFIIDELDRCRPTFAIELLERVKHIFDVPNIVFVFGINRSELVKSLESLYGEIDAGVYLRRFFDMEFILPDADPAKFCAHLVRAYGLDTFFSGLSKTQGHPFHAQELKSLSNALPISLGRMGLSLRDMDYCLRLVALAGKSLRPGNSMFPEVVAILVAVKISNPELYRRFVQGRARAAEVVDYVNERRNSYGADVQLTGFDEAWYRGVLEAAIYTIDDWAMAKRQLAQLQAIRDSDLPVNIEKELDHPELLAKETRELDPHSEVGKGRLSNLLDALEFLRGRQPSYRRGVPYLAELIDMYDSTLRQ